MLDAMRTALGLLLVVSLFQATPTPAAVWPPAGVYLPTEGVTRPEVLRKLTPQYTANAMRAKIQGFVTLQFVVEPDGSVGPVRVIASLDVVHGLDVAAINTLKQWLFKPGTRNGAPVRVLSTAVLSFGIRELAPPMTLPAGFDAGPPASAATWTRESVDSTGVHIDLAYPDGYQRYDPPGTVIGAVDQKSLRSVGVSRPMPLPVAIPFPMPIAQLAQFAETMRLQFSQTGKGLETVAVGQSTIGQTNWLWLELEAPTSSFQSAPPEIAAMMRDQLDGVRIWAFSTSVGLNLVQVMCVAPGLAGTTPAARDAALASARSECSETLKRVSFTAR
jgi:TonB family protein